MASTDSLIKVVVEFLSLEERGSSVIISFFSTFFLGLLLQVNNKVEAFIIVLEGFVIWSVCNYTLIFWILGVVPDESAKQWHDVVANMTQFISMLCIFLVIQFLLSLVETTWFTTDFSIWEVLAAIYVIMITKLTLTKTLKSLTNYRTFENT